MRTVSILALVGLTSAGAYLFGLKALGLSARDCKAAAGRMLECIGVSLLFLAANLAVALSVVLAVRHMTETFVPVYFLGDIVWPVLSFVQGLTFQWWRELSSRRHPRQARS